MSKKVYQVGDEPTYSKVDKVYVVNPSEGGGGVADEVAWENVTNKPSLFPPTEHNHDDRYYTKDEAEDHVNFVRELMEQEQGKVKSREGDDLGYLETKVDNVTVKVEGNELKAKALDGLTIGSADISEWLAGTDGNIQSQIDGINETLGAITSGMRYQGRLETYADLQDVTVMDNGDLFVVLADESREGGRSMYIYSEDTGVWEFIGAFTFTEKFTALGDTPSDYQDGKYLRSTSSGIVYDDVDYQALKNKPVSTITDIDDAVAKKHEHSNKNKLEGIGESVEGILTYKGIEYVRKDQLINKEKDFLFLGKDGNKTISENTPLSFDLFYAGNMDYTPTTFTLNEGKVYRVVASVLFTSIATAIGLKLKDVTNNKVAVEYPDVKWFYSPQSNNHANGNGVFDFIIKPSSTKKFQIVASNITGGVNSVTQYSRNSTLSIHEI